MIYGDLELHSRTRRRYERVHAHVSRNSRTSCAIISPCNAVETCKTVGPSGTHNRLLIFNFTEKSMLFQRFAPVNFLKQHPESAHHIAVDGSSSQSSRSRQSQGVKLLSCLTVGLSTSLCEDTGHRTGTGYSCRILCMGQLYRCPGHR